MNKDDIIRMAREAGASHDGPLFVPDAFVLRFAALVAAAEREACAQVCDEQSDKDGFEGGYANECAELIRSRGIDGAKVGEVGVWCKK